MDNTLDKFPNDDGMVPDKEHELKSLQITVKAISCVKREFIEMT